MTLELGNFKYDGSRFYINEKQIKLSRMRFKILKLLADNYKLKPITPANIIHELYYDIDYRKDEPDSASFKVIVHSIKKILNHMTDNKVTITANKGAGYTLDYNINPIAPYQCKLSKQTKERILMLHEKNNSATSIASQLGISKHKVYDILIRSKQRKHEKDILGIIGN